MKTDEIWIIVSNTQRQILAVDFFGEMKFFVVKSFSPKTRDLFFNEVRGAQDITDLIEHNQFQLSTLNPVSIEERLQSRPLQDFKFGHDNYIWFISQKQNTF